MGASHSGASNLNLPTEVAERFAAREAVYKLAVELGIVSEFGCFYPNAVAQKNGPGRLASSSGRKQSPGKGGGRVDRL